MNTLHAESDVSKSAFKIDARVTINASVSVIQLALYSLQ